MKQRFLNQKLGKRTSRKAELQKAKAAAWSARGASHLPKSKPSARGGRVPQGSASPPRPG